MIRSALDTAAPNNDFAAIQSAAAPAVGNTVSLRTILLAGCAAAAIDLAFAFLFFGIGFGVAPMRVMHSIASGFFGSAAFEGGATTAAIGVVAHFFILIVAASFYYLASRRFAWLSRNAIVSGLLFGLAIYVVMTFLVLPLSATPPRHSVWTAALGQFLIHPVIGVAIALIVRRSAGRGRDAAF